MTNPAVYLSPVINAQVLLTANGNVNVNGNISVFYGQTTTAAPTYTDNTGANLTANPIQIGIGGRVPYQIWIPQGQATRFVIYDVTGIEVETLDDILGVNDPSLPMVIANTAYNTANLAFLQANVANQYSQTALTTANAAKVTANAGANTVAVYSNGTLVSANANLNFNNTASINAIGIIGKTANGTLGSANLSLAVNVSALTLSTAQSLPNGWVSIASNSILQWGSVVPPSSLYTGTALQVNFAKSFPNKCWSVQVSASGPGQSQPSSLIDFVIRLDAGQTTTAHFKLVVDDLTGSPPTPPLLPIYWIAVGY